MPPKTRKAKKEDTEEEIEETAEEVKPGKLPESDESYSRKIVIAKENSLPNSRIIKLRHPKEGCALFRISESHFDEVLAVNDGHRSLFYGESVISDGTVHIFAPYHPVFVCLPYLEKSKEKFVEIGEILVDEQFPGIAELVENARVQKMLEAVADVKEVLEVKLVRLNEQKMMEWMGKKFQKLRTELEKDAHKTLLECPDAFDRHVFSLLSDYLPPSLLIQVRLHLNIPEAVATENVDMSMKRKIQEEDELEKQPAAKKPRESVQKKKLQAASKGTKNIASFFGKKTFPNVGPSRGVENRARRPRNLAADGLRKANGSIVEPHLGRGRHAHRHQEFEGGACDVRRAIRDPRAALPRILSEPADVPLPDKNAQIARSLLR